MRTVELCVLLVIKSSPRLFPGGAPGRIAWRSHLVGPAQAGGRSNRPPSCARADCEDKKQMSVSLRTTLLVCAIVLYGFPLLAQEMPVSAGGKWVRSEQQDPANGRKLIVFTLPADEAELGRSPDIELICDGDGKFVRARYFADTALRATDGDYQNYNEPAIVPKIRIDKKNFKGLWDLLPDQKSAALDKKTIRAIFKGSEMEVRYRDSDYDNLVDAFSVSGLDKRLVVKACGDQGWFQE